MSFHNLTKAENELYYENGQKNMVYLLGGLTLEEAKLKFLKETTYKQINKNKNRQEEYQHLFKY